MILGLILLAILCMIAIAAAYDTSGDKTINHEIASAHVQGLDYDDLEQECQQNVEHWNSAVPKW